jgi:diguanylate cyclase (GGDEF)-like protein
MMRIAGTEYYLAILDLVVMISMIFIIPNKFFYKLLVGVVAHIGFFIFAYYTIPDLSSNQFLTGMVYGTCIILIIVMTHHKINYFDRVKFLNEKELIILSETDALTGVYNRAKFDSELIKWIKLKKRYDHPISIVLMDFDNFKGVNDRFGHLRGDQILKDSAEIVRENTRETDVFARWGGEEFIILMPDTRRKNAIAIAERIRKSIEQHAFCIQDQVTCSFGVTEVYHNDTAYSVFDRVDELLYTAKSEGRNVVVS